MIIEVSPEEMRATDALDGLVERLGRFELAKRVLPPERPERVRARAQLYDFIDRHVQEIAPALRARVGTALADPAEQVKTIDVMILHWRRRAAGTDCDTSEDRRLTECAPYYVDALQSVRMNLFGALLPLEAKKE